MRKSRSKSDIPAKPEWATSVLELRQRLNLNQTDFGQRLHSSAMSVSRWERGNQEPGASSYIELGNLAGDPDCWFFWGRAGLRSEGLMRVMPNLRRRVPQSNLNNFQVVHAGASARKPEKPHLVGIPLLRVVAATNGEKGDNMPILHEAPVETMIAAPVDWCPNPSATICLRVRGNAMMPLIGDGYILAVDSSQTDTVKLNGKVVISLYKDMELMVSRLQHYDHTEVLQPENREYEPIVLGNKNKWKIFGKVLWWIGKEP